MTQLRGIFKHAKLFKIQICCINWLTILIHYTTTLLDNKNTRSLVNENSKEKLHNRIQFQTKHIDLKISLYLFSNLAMSYELVHSPRTPCSTKAQLKVHLNLSPSLLLFPSYGLQHAAKVFSSSSTPIYSPDQVAAWMRSYRVARREGRTILYSSDPYLCFVKEDEQSGTHKAFS